MNIAENLQLLQQTKEDIYQAIIAVGGELEASAPFSAYSAAIMAIRTESLYGEVEASVASPAFYVTEIPSPPATSSNYCDGYVIGIGKTEGFEPWSDDTFNFNNDVLVCEFFKKNNQDVYCAKNSEHYTGGGIALNAAHMTELRQNNRLPIDVTSGGTYYVGVWKFHKATSGTGDPYILDEQLPVTISAATPSEIPEGLHKFTISQSNWPDCAMMVEAFYNPTKLRKGERGSQTVNIYEDPNGEPVNTITYDSYVFGGSEETDVQNTNANAGVYCSNLNDWPSYEAGSQAFKLECRTAGTYYIEVVDHANPRFYDNNGTQIYPDNHVNS